MKDWLPDDHLVYFIMDVVGELDLSASYQRYDNSKGGQPPFDPKMMVSLLFYAYCVGLPSSRKIEKATYERIAFRILTADQHPDHDTIADFRKRHLDALSGSFVQILRLCQEVGLVKLGHVSLDGTKVKANASMFPDRLIGPFYAQNKPNLAIRIRSTLLFPSPRSFGTSRTLRGPLL